MLRAVDFKVMPLTIAVLVLLPLTIAIAELSGVRAACLSNATAWSAMLSLVVAWAYGCWRKLAFVPVVCELVLIYTTIVIVVLLYSYVTLRPGLPIADAALHAADKSIGLSVSDVVFWVDDIPWLAWALHKCYHSLGLQLGFLPVILALVHTEDRAARMLVAQLAICLVGCSISIGWPAVGSFHFLGIGMHDLKNLDGSMGYHFHEGFFRARQDEIFVLSTDLISGVSTFPSIHAALAILCVWAAWPVRWLRVPFVVLNIGMYASTIPVGAHYGVDVAAGTALALTVLLIVRKLPDDLWRRRLACRRAKASYGQAESFA